ncbi:unnamed protein product [Gadus morhua 'NCC']
MFFLFCYVNCRVNSRSGRFLLFLVGPGHLLFLYTTRLFQGGHATLTPAFTLWSLGAPLLQVRPSPSGPWGPPSSRSDLHPLVPGGPLLQVRPSPSGPWGPPPLGQTFTLWSLGAPSSSYVLEVLPMTQVVLLLYRADLMVRWMWSRRVVPDSSSIPYLTTLGPTLGHLLGTWLLALSLRLAPGPRTRALMADWGVGGGRVGP